MTLDVSRETFERLQLFERLLLEENSRQNLISKATEEAAWTRHIEDSAQLVNVAPGARSWVDIGSGPGLPGMVIAIMTEGPVTLVEPRALRIDFLRRAAAALGLNQVTIVHGKAQAASGEFDAITARAVAPASDLIRMTMHLSHSRTQWVLPKGRSAQSELEEVSRAWQGSFRLVPSDTDPEAHILVGESVRPRGKR